MTLTRCSSTPSAEILVNPDGSTRRTFAVQLAVAAPLLDDRPGAGLDAHGIGREEIGHDLELRGIANLEQRLAGGHDALALAQALQHDAVRRRASRRRRGRSHRTSTGEPRLRRAELRVSGCAPRNRRGVHRLPAPPARRPRGRRFPAAWSSRLGRARERGPARVAACASALRAPLLLGAGAAERRSRAFDRRLRLGARPRVEQRRRLGAHPGDDLAARHRIARLELDPQHAARDRGRDDEPIADPGRAPPRRRSRPADPRCTVDTSTANGPRPQRDGGQAGNRPESRRPAGARLARNRRRAHRHSRVFSTPTDRGDRAAAGRSAPRSATAPITVRNDQAMVAGRARRTTGGTARC